MAKEQIALLVGLAFAVVFGFLTARSSNKREKIYGGLLAQVFHYIGAGSFVAVLPVVLTSLIVGGGFKLAFPMGVGFLVTSLVALVVFAIFERPALEAAKRKIKTEDRGWTKEDAISSGL
jgi:uncharacterized membrane protein (DUF485 family)